MNKVLLRLATFTMVFQLMTPAYCINYKVLEEEAETCTSRIWSEAPLSKAKILEKLDFLQEEDTKNILGSQSRHFYSFCEDLGKRVKDEKLLRFAHDCKAIYEEKDDLLIRKAIPLLLEKVAEKYTRYLTMAERFKGQNGQPPMKDQDRRQILDLLLRADRDITIK